MQTAEKIVPNLMDAISVMDKTEKKKPTNKNGFPVIDDRELREHVDLQAEAAIAEKKAKAENAYHKLIIADRVRAIMDQDGYAGRFSGTYVVLGNNHQANCTFANKWKVDDEAALRSLLGNNAFDCLFERKLTVKLKKAVLEDPKKAHRLMELLGQEILEFFEYDESYASREDVDIKEEIYNLVPKDKLNEFRDAAKQDFPSIKYVNNK